MKLAAYRVSPVTPDFLVNRNVNGLVWVRLHLKGHALNISDCSREDLVDLRNALDAVIAAVDGTEREP